MYISVDVYAYVFMSTNSDVISEMCIYTLGVNNQPSPLSLCTSPASVLPLSVYLLPIYHLAL